MTIDLKPCPLYGDAAELDSQQGYTYMSNGIPNIGTAVAGTWNRREISND